MSDTPRTDEVWGSTQGRGYQMMLLSQKLERELAEVEEENLKLSALVVERDYQITLANKGYDYEGAVEDARHYKEVAKKAEAELADYKLWAEVEIADMMDEAVEDVAAWGAYAHEYFQEERDLDGTLKKWQDRATAIRKGK